MAITVVSSTSAAYNSSSPSVTIPATTVNADDIILAFIAHGNDENVSIDALNGTDAFTEICDDLQTSGFGDVTTLAGWLRASGGEESDTINFSVVSSRKGVAAVIVLRGVDATTAIDTAVTHASHHVDDTLAQDGSDADTNAFPSYSTTTDGAMAFRISAYRHESSAEDVSAVNTDSGGTDWFEETGAGAIDDVLALGEYEIIATAGAAGGDVHTYVGCGHASSQRVHQLIFAFRPASGGGGTDTMDVDRSQPRGHRRGNRRGAAYAFERIDDLFLPKRPLVVPVRIQLAGAR